MVRSWKVMLGIVVALGACGDAAPYAGVRRCASTYGGARRHASADASSPVGSSELSARA